MWRRPWVAATILGGVVLVAHRRVAKLRRQQATQAEFSRQLITLQENERRRLAGELHDGLGQQLLIIANWAKLATHSLEASDRARSSLEVIGETATRSIGDIRRITHELQPYELEHVGLGAAIHAMLGRVGEASGIKFTTAIDAVDDVVTPVEAIHVYRIVQEAVNNTIRHAQATQASVAIRRTPAGVELRISDNGCGFVCRAERDGGGTRGFGLRSMAARARLLGGTHSIQSRPGEGTTVAVDIRASQRIS
jgi:signal transduction histidine kinase